MKKEYRSTARTKKMIREAFVELLGEKKSIESITIGELVERANIAKSTFYNHYMDIYEVAEEFENELIMNLSMVFHEMEVDRATEYEVYIRKIIIFFKDNEISYRNAMSTPDARFVVEKLKTIFSKKLFEESSTLPFSKNKAERYVQIHILTNACAETIADYFRGVLPVSLDEVGNILIDFINRLNK